jgi:hypothetical protein|tara:strand:+ start:923 stop:1111 length:189 start_codon:yes stop_codon:yes gene_type:complete
MLAPALEFYPCLFFWDDAFDGLVDCSVDFDAGAINGEDDVKKAPESYVLSKLELKPPEAAVL